MLNAIAQVFSPVSYSFTAISLFFIFLGIMILITAFFILSKNPKSKINQSFFLTSIPLFLWIFFGYGIPWSLNKLDFAFFFYKYFGFLGVIFIGPTMFNFFFQINLVDKKWKNRIKWLFGFSLIYYLASILTPFFYASTPIRQTFYGSMPAYSLLNLISGQSSRQAIDAQLSSENGRKPYSWVCCAYHHQIHPPGQEFLALVQSVDDKHKEINWAFQIVG